jgi:hypothetical protein
MPKLIFTSNEGIYRGVDKGYLITDRRFAGSDTLATSYAISQAIKKITIKHSQLGVLRNYLYPEPISKAMVFELVLTTARIIVDTTFLDVPIDWVVFTSQPDGAVLYLDETFIGNTPQSLKKKNPGKYQSLKSYTSFREAYGTLRSLYYELVKKYNKMIQVEVKNNNDK